MLSASFCAYVNSLAFLPWTYIPLVQPQARLVSQTLRPRQELWLAVVAAATRLEHWAALFRRRRTFVVG